MSASTRRPEVADALGISVGGIRKLRQRGELGYVEGRPVRIRQSHLDAYLARRDRRAAP